MDAEAITLEDLSGTAAAAVPAGESAGHSEATPGKVGMWIFLVTDALTFGGLLIAYASLRAWSATWPDPASRLDIPLTAFNTFLLICSSVTMVLAVQAAEQVDRRGVIRWLAATIAGGCGFLGIQAYEYHHLLSQGLTISTDLMAGTFYMLTSFHGAHVFSGVVYLSVLFVGVLAGKFVGHGDARVEIAGLFWHFVDLIWILIFTFVYLI